MYIEDSQHKLKRYKLWYKIFTVIGTLVLLESIIFQPAGIPFIAALVLYPLLGLFLGQETILIILGLYLSSWILFFIPAIVLNRKIKKIEKENGIKIEPQRASKGFKITLMAILIPFGVLFLVGIIVNLVS